MLGAVDFSITDHSKRSGRKQTSQIAIALFADVAEPVLASARVLPRDETNPGREVPSRSESLRVSDTGDQCSGEGRSNAGDRVEPPACLTGAMPSPDHTIEFQDLRLQPSQLGAESRNTGACNLRQSVVS